MTEWHLRTERVKPQMNVDDTDQTDFHYPCVSVSSMQSMSYRNVSASKVNFFKI